MGNFIAVNLIEKAVLDIGIDFVRVWVVLEIYIGQRHERLEEEWIYGKKR